MWRLVANPIFYERINDVGRKKIDWLPVQKDKPVSGFAPPKKTKKAALTSRRPFFY